MRLIVLMSRVGGECLSRFRLPLSPPISKSTPLYLVSQLSRYYLHYLSPASTTTSSQQHQGPSLAFHPFPQVLPGIPFTNSTSYLQQYSPRTATVLATSTGHPDAFGIMPESVTFPIGGVLGTQTREIRSDLVYYDTHAGGAVFSVGSINWFNSLAWDGFDNNIARLTGNVLREFIRRKEGKGS